MLKFQLNWCNISEQYTKQLIFSIHRFLLQYQGDTYKNKGQKVTYSLNNKYKLDKPNILNSLTLQRADHRHYQTLSVTVQRLPKYNKFEKLRSITCVFIMVKGFLWQYCVTIMQKYLALMYIM